VAASRGRADRMTEEAIVSGRSGSWEAESGIALLLSAGVPGLETGLGGAGGEGGGIFSVVVSCCGSGEERLSCVRFVRLRFLCELVQCTEQHKHVTKV
jgi:hypothetical protein